MVDSIPYLILIPTTITIADLIVDWADSEIKRLESQVSNRLNNAYIRGVQ